MSSDVSDGSQAVVLDYATLPPIGLNDTSAVGLAVSADSTQALARNSAGVYWCAISQIAKLYVLELRRPDDAT